MTARSRRPPVLPYGWLRDLGRGVPQRRAHLVCLDLVDGALPAVLGFVGPLAQPAVNNDAHTLGRALAR
jgi:hypothetical protein